MKKNLLTFCALIVALTSTGQAKYYKPFYNNPSWTLVYTNFSITNYIHYKYQKDSVIGTNTYKKIEMFNNQNTNNSGYVLLREDIPAKKIYQRNTTTSQDFVYIDFTLAVGNQFQLNVVGSTFNTTVTAKDSVLVSGNYHNSLILTDTFSTSYRFTEGVLSLKDPLNPKISANDPQFYLVCMCKGGYSYYLLNPTTFTCGITCSPPTAINEKVAGTATEVLVSPNPANDVLRINTDCEHNSSLLVYDGVGRKLEQQSLSPGKNETVLKTGNYPPGVYLLSLLKQNGVLVSKRFIIHR